MTCPKCNSENLKKNGKDGFTKAQRHLCKDCGHQFAPDNPVYTHEYKASNAYKLEHHKKTYKDFPLKLRYNTHDDLIKRMEAYAAANPARGEAQKKAIEILDEHFPKI